MKSLAVLLLMLGACAQSRPVTQLRADVLVASPSPTPPSMSEAAGVTDAWVVGGRLYAIEGNPRSLLEIDMASGTSLWRRPLDPGAKAPFLLANVGPHHVGLFASKKTFVYDGTTGRLVDAYDTQIEAPSELDERDGVCTISSAGDGAAQLVDCDTARPIGPIYDARRIPIPSSSGGVFVDCARAKLTPIGRNHSGALIFVTGPGTQDSEEAYAVSYGSLVGIDPATGGILFSIPLWQDIESSWIPGLDPSKRYVSFVLDSGDVITLSAATGRIVAGTEEHLPGDAQPPPPQYVRGYVRFSAWLSTPRPTLLVNLENVAEIVDVVSGHQRQIPLKRGEIALAENATLPAFHVGSTDDMRLRLIDFATGETKRTQRIGSTLGYMSLGGKLLAVPDHGRAWTTSLETTRPSRVIDGRFEALRNGDRTEILDRYDHRTALSIDHDAWIVGVAPSARGAVLAMGSRTEGSSTFDVELVTVPIADADGGP